MSAFADFVGDMIADYIIPACAMLLVVAVIIAMPVFGYVIYKSAKSPTFDLRKDEWQCSASVERASTTYIKSGNVLIPVTSHYKHCTQWSERP